MNLTQQAKIEVLLDKLNLIYSNLKDQDDIPKFELQLMEKYARELHELTRQMTETGSKPAPNIIQPKAPEPKEQPVEAIDKKEEQREQHEQKEEKKQEEKHAPLIFVDEKEEKKPSEEPARYEPQSKIQPKEEKTLREEPVRQSEVKEAEKPKPEAARLFLKNTSPEEEHDEHSLNSRYREEQSMLADKLKLKNVGDLRTDIDLNDRFWFINNLFEGDSEDYKRAITQLNSFNNFSEAKNYIDSQLMDKYNWKQNEKASSKFITFVKRRFSQEK